MTARKKIFIAAAVLLVAGLVAAIFFRQPLTRKLVDWRIQKNLVTYREASEAGDWKTAQRYALAAHQLNPHRLDTLLALLHVGIEDRSQHRGNLAAVAVRVIHHPAAPASEKATALKVFLDAGDGVVFFRLFERLNEDEQRQPQIACLYASYLGSIGEIENAARILEALLANPAGKDHDELALQLAQVLAVAVVGNEGVAARIQQLVTGLLKGPDRAMGLRALGLLQRVPIEQLSAAELLQAADWVDSYSSASVADRLMLVSLRIQHQPEQSASLIEQATSEFGGLHPEIVARWLAARGEYAEALQVLSEDVARKAPEGYIARARILYRAGQLSEAERWLQAPHNGVPPSVVSTLRAVVTAAESGDSERWWRKALQQAELEATADAFWRISGSAAAIGNREVEMRAATEALKRPGAHPSVNDLGPVFVWLYENDRVEDLRQVLRILIRREPESPILRNNLAYLQIVTGRSNDELLSELQGLHERFPDVPEIATSLAVAELERGDSQKARDLLLTHVEDWATAPATTLAAFAVASVRLGSEGSPAPSGESIEAFRGRIRWSEMLETEREFFQTRMNSATLSSSQGSEAGTVN